MMIGEDIDPGDIDEDGFYVGDGKNITLKSRSPRIVIELNSETKRAFKTCCTEDGMTMKEFVMDAIHDYLEMKEREGQVDDDDF